MTKYQTPIGMHDLLAEDIKYFQKIEKVCQEMAKFYGFDRIEPPILEQSLLFEKGTGQSTEIVQKQMFSLRTKGGDHLTLRPEYTPSIIRAYFEHGMGSLPKPVNLWYFGPCFRYERPQAGRYRQFYQFGFESLGSNSWIVDAQIIQIFYNILKNLGFKNLIIEINSVGDSQCRPYYKKVLKSYLRSRRNSLCSDCKIRLTLNPLRILDCKNEKCQKIIKEEAPQILDHLCKDCSSHFKRVLETLDELNLPYILNPYLVRGLDYYSKTVFEIFPEKDKEKAQGTLAGGGRYDDLGKTLEGKEIAACGCASGVDRIANLMRQKTKKTSKIPESKIFLAQVGELAKKKGLKLFEAFRKQKINIAQALHKDSLSLQLKIADKIGARYVLILGQKESLEEKIIVRDMKNGKQKTIALSKVAKEMKRKTKN